MNRPARLLCRGRCWAGCAGLALSVVLISPNLAVAGTLLPPDAATTIGRRIPFDGFVGENGQEFSALLSEQAGDTRPWIISPMYTRCPSTCSAVTAHLRRALTQSDLTPSEYRVLSFSFDPNETQDGLRKFHTRMQLPADWLVLRARDPQALERTLGSIDFRTITLGDGNFEHPNLLAVLAPDMRLVAYVFGVDFSAAELGRAVRRARAGASVVDAWRPYLFLVAAIGFLVSALVFAWLLSTRWHRRSQLGAPPSGPVTPSWQ